MLCGVVCSLLQQLIFVHDSTTYNRWRQSRITQHLTLSIAHNSAFINDYLILQKLYRRCNSSLSDSRQHHKSQHAESLQEVRPCSARQERTIGKRPEKDGAHEESVQGINILIPLLATTASRRGNSSIAKGIALGIRYLRTMRPVRQV